MTSCIVGKKIRAMGPGPLELFPFVVLAILMAMAGGISEHMLTSWSSSLECDMISRSCELDTVVSFLFFYFCFSFLFYRDFSFYLY